MRSLIAVPCEGDTLAATLDAAPGRTGLLIVSGGNEIRSGAHRGMAMLAHRIATRGIPVFRYDRRGIGDSTGRNDGFASARPDLIAATAAFCAAMPQITRIVGFGNCDAATTLAMFGHDARIDTIILANPWLADERDALPPAAAIRLRYLERLRNPRTWLRVLRGDVDLRKFARGLKKIAATSPDTPGVPVRRAIQDWGQHATIILATGDATAQAFANGHAGPARTIHIDTASHSFAGTQNAASLEAEIMAALELN